jgi:hypothetical protein
MYSEVPSLGSPLAEDEDIKIIFIQNSLPVSLTYIIVSLFSSVDSNRITNSEVYMDTSFLPEVVFPHESHSSKVALLNLQRLPTFKAGINPFFAKREMVRT